MNFPPCTISWYVDGAWTDDVTLQSLGYTDPIFKLLSRASSTVTIKKSGDDPANPADIDYQTPVRIYAELAGLNSGEKTIIFQGRRTDFTGSAEPASRNTEMVFSDAWWDLENIVFQHYWQTSDGTGGVTTKFAARLYLFTDISGGPTADWAYLPADAQLLEIIDYAKNQCDAIIQAGTIDPAWNMPWIQIKAISCAQANLEVLRPMPDTCTFFDYSTTPPTLHIRQRSNLDGITMPWAETNANGTSHKSSRIKPRPDLQAPQVVIQYQDTTTIDGNDLVDFPDDAYPIGSEGNAIGALVVPIDLRGGSIKNVFGSVTGLTADPTANAFWIRHKADLANVTGLTIFNTAINDGSPGCITIVDSTGAPVDIGTYGQEVKPGQVCPWMTLPETSTPVVAKEVTISVLMSYAAANASGVTGLGSAVSKHPISVSINLTNSPNGTTRYSALASETSGDPTITGLAYYMWCSINNVPLNYVDGVLIPPDDAPSIDNPYNLQWEGTHTVVEQIIHQIISPGYVLNLSGPGSNTDWATMNAAIYEVEIDLFHGRTVIRFGPHLHVNAQQFFEMLTAWRNRVTFENPAIRNTGQASASGSDVTLGTSMEKENTNHSALPSLTLQTIATIPTSGDSPTQTMVQHDPGTNGGQVIIQTVDDAGDVVDDTVDIRMAAGDIDPDIAQMDPTDGKPVMCARLLNLCDNTGMLGTAYFQMTEPVAS